MFGLALFASVSLFRVWKAAGDRGGQQPADPFRIAGNFYYVGASDAAAFLITGPEGHIVLDGGYPGTAEMIEASITRLGFKISDVKVLLNSEPHGDHAGGLAALQQASGALTLVGLVILTLPACALLLLAPGYPVPIVTALFALAIPFAYLCSNPQLEPVD